MDLQTIFNTLVGGKKTLTLAFNSRKEYDSLRVSLVRKFSAYVALCRDAGIETYDDLYLRAQWDGASKEGTFNLQSKAEAKRLKKEYVVKII